MYVYRKKICYRFSFIWYISDSSADASRATGSLRGMISLDTSVGFPEPSHSNSQMIALEKKETEIKKLKQEVHIMSYTLVKIIWFLSYFTDLSMHVHVR